MKNEFESRCHIERTTHFADRPMYGIGNRFLDRNVLSTLPAAIFDGTPALTTL